MGHEDLVVRDPAALRLMVEVRATRCTPTPESWLLGLSPSS